MLFHTAGGTLDGFQLMFTHGKQTPRVGTQTGMLTTIKVKSTKNVASISMKTSGGFYFYGLRFLDEDNQYIVNREWDKNLGEWTTP